MNAAHDIHANQPQPFTGRAVPPDSIQADNDDAVAGFFHVLVQWLATPTETIIGGVRLLLPAGKPVLSDARLRLLSRAWIAADERRTGAVELNVRKLERLCWPKDFDPHKAWPLPFGRDLAAERKAKIRSERNRIKELNAKAATAPPPQSVMDKLAEARKERMKAERLKIADPKGNRQKIKDHQTAAKLAEREAASLHVQAKDEDWAYRASQETDQLAEARGEGVVSTREGKRIMARNGIVQAYRAGYLEPTLTKMGEADLYDAAKLYRACACVISGMTTPERGEGGFNAKGPQVRVIEAGEALAVMRTGLTKFQIEVLDRVCGLDMRAREVATVLHRGFPAVRTALSEGLSMVVINLRAERALRKKRDDEPSFAQQMAAKHTAILAAQRAA